MHLAVLRISDPYPAEALSLSGSSLISVQAAEVVGAACSGYSWPFTSASSVKRDRMLQLVRTDLPVESYS